MIYHSSIMIDDVDRQLQLLKGHGGPVVIFGTGNYGALALHALNKHGVKVDCFCDNNKANWGSIFCGRRIISPDELLGSFQDAVVLIAHLQFKYMASQLRGNKGIQVLNCDFLFKDLDLSGVEAPASSERLVWMLDLYMFAIDAAKDPESLKIKSLDVVVTERCSLRCKDCSNLMQYYRNPKDCDLDILLLAIDRFMTNVGELHEARVIGGEPFMYTKLAEVIGHLSSCGNCEKITIFTNGTIIPKNDVLESLRNDKVSLIISDYGKLSRNSSKLKTLMNQMQIPFITYDIDSWQDCSTISYHERAEGDLAYIFGNCCVNDALTLLHGKVYVCPFSAHADNLGAIPQAKDDEVDLINGDVAMIKEKIRALCADKKYISACSYCAGRDYGVGRIGAAVQAPSPLPFNVYRKGNDPL